MDSAVVPLKKSGLSLVQTVDFFYPLIDDPYAMGKIALANVVSDVFAVGVTNIDKITLILSASTELSENECYVIIPMIIKGFQDGVKEVNDQLAVKIDNIALNSFCIIGGVATSVCTPEEIIMPSGAMANDALVLTKPLGTQLATNSYIWMLEKSPNWLKLQDTFTEDDIHATYKIAIESMTRLNKTAAQLMHKYKAHAATDVTGFGLVGHAKNLVEFQIANVDFIIDTLPIIKNVQKIAVKLQNNRLLSGQAVETSGGLLISMPSNVANDFCRDYEKACQHSAWIIGRVVDGSRQVKVADTPKFLDAE